MSLVRENALKTDLPKPDNHVVFITIFSTVICMFTPVIDVNLSKATHKKLMRQAKYKINILTVTPGEPRHS